MPPKDNTGAITIRCPTKGEPRKRFLELKDQALAEFERNKQTKKGPTTFAGLYREMSETRYASQLGQAAADDTRVAAESKGQEAPAAAPSADDLFG